jgi:hypothetical protein
VEGDFFAAAGAEFVDVGGGDEDFVDDWPGGEVDAVVVDLAELAGDGGNHVMLILAERGMDRPLTSTSSVESRSRRGATDKNQMDADEGLTFSLLTLLAPVQMTPAFLGKSLNRR